MSASDAGRTEDAGGVLGGRRSLGFALIVGGCVGVVAAILLIVIGGPRGPADVQGLPPVPADATWAAGARPAPDFTLANQDGRAVSLSSLRGRVVLLTFLDSRCTHLCRLEGPLLGEVQRALPEAERPLIVVVSVNTDDTAASVRAAARTWGWRPDDWQWLMGDPEHLANVWEAYGVDVQRTPGDLLHTGALYVIDRAGDERAGYATPFDQERVTRLVDALGGMPS